jgi:hypothetical protein
MGQLFARGEGLSSSLFVSLVTWLLFRVVIGRVARMITALLGTVWWEGPVVIRRVSRLAGTPGRRPA